MRASFQCTNLFTRAALCIRAWPWKKFGQSSSQIRSLACAIGVSFFSMHQPLWHGME